jgi:tRNA pseudouridine55 synthase
MILLIGEGTKLSDYILSEDKRYWVRLKLGVTTDTLDRTGEILEHCAVDLTEDQIRRAIEDHVGEFEWIVPQYSAVKVKGRKLYEYARLQKPVEAPRRKMRFYDLDIHEIGNDFATMEISCTKGSYIRSWVDNIGRSLGCGAVLDELRRLRCEPFSVEEAIGLDALQEQKDQTADAAELMTWKGFLPMSKSLPQYRSVLILKAEQRLLRHGQIARSLAGRLLPDIRECLTSQQTTYLKAMDEEGGFMALLEVGPQGLKVRRVFASNREVE